MFSFEMLMLNYRLNNLPKWKCFAMLHETSTFTCTTLALLLLPLLFSLSLMPCHHALIPIRFQEATGYQSTICELLLYIKKFSLPSVLGRTLLLNHLMVKQRSAIFSARWLALLRQAGPGLYLLIGCVC